MSPEGPAPRRGWPWGSTGTRGPRRDGRHGSHRGAQRGLLSVVLSGSIAEAAPIASALEALMHVAEEAPDLEVVLAPWGPGNPDVLRTVAEHAALAGLDVRLAPHAGTGNAARNRGGEIARGDHLLFLDPLTRMRRGALTSLLAGSRRERGYRVVRAVGDRNPFHTASYLFARAFWLDSVVRFDEAHGDHPDAACARALALRPVRVEGQLWDRVPPVGAATGEMPSWAESVQPWLAMVPTVRQMVQGPEKAQWIRDLLVHVLPGLLADAERLPFALLPEIADAVGAVLAALPANELARVPVEARALAWLGGQAKWAELAELLARRATHEGQFPTRTEQTRVYADLPGVDWQALHVPPPILEVGLDETRLEAGIRRFRWLDEAEGTVLAVDLFTVVRHLGLANPTIQARWVGPDATVPARVVRRGDPAVAVVSAHRYQDHGQGSVTVLTPVASLPSGPWYLELAVTQGLVVRTGRPLKRDMTGSAGVLRPSPDGRVRPGWDARGLRLEVGAASIAPPVPVGPRVVGVHVEDDWLAVRVAGRIAAESVVLSRPGGRLRGHVDGDVVRFRLRESRFGLPEAPAACGHYRMLVGGAEVPWDARAQDDVSHGLRSVAHRVWVRRTPRGGLAIDLRPPLRDEELGAFGQARVLSSYDVEQVLVDRVLLESLAGRACTGSPLALDRELARVRPDLERVWVVEEHAVQPPAGARTVLRHSREWHAMLATSRLLVTDGDLPAFFTRRESQVVVQTLRGYPARSMGVDTWNESHLAPRRIAHLLERSSGQWSALVAPSHRLEHWFREAHAYRGEMLTVGQPRTDLLLRPDTAERRRLTRRRLGIGEDQLVVFYAPEPGTHPVYSVRPRELMDVAELAQALGPRRTLLLRDPAPGRRPVRVPGAARVVDVTEHPEVSDVMLASDVGVFDYSALRFDYALTGRPMLFQVPDPSVRRGDARGFLFPYVETAPGPVTATADDVVTLLGDLDGLARHQAPAVARFNAEFNDMADGQVARRVVAELFGARFRHTGLALVAGTGTVEGEGRPAFRVVR